MKKKTSMKVITVNSRESKCEKDRHKCWDLEQSIAIFEQSNWITTFMSSGAVKF